jgi:hypothetical protein
LYSNCRLELLEVSAMRLLPVLLIAAACATPLARADAVAACERIADTTLSGAEVLHATAVPAGPLRADDREPAAVGTTSLPAHCRVSLVARPSPDSHIRIEVWMPSAGWNGRFEAVGNGNYAGMLSMDALPHGILRGSVIATTDTGHESTPADPKLADWAVHRGKLLDFGHRAIHEMARLGKALGPALRHRAQKRVLRVLLQRRSARAHGGATPSEGLRRDRRRGAGAQLDAAQQRFHIAPSTVPARPGVATAAGEGRAAAARRTCRLRCARWSSGWHGGRSAAVSVR